MNIVFLFFTYHFIFIFAVALKGRVALQIGINELLITELILKNVLTVLQPAEIAALLSALIFHQKSNSESTFPDDFHHLRKVKFNRISCFFLYNILSN